MSQLLTNTSLPIIFLILGALFSVVGTSLAMHQQTLAEKRLRERTEQIAGVVTSGDSFPSAIISHPRGNKNILELWIKNNGENPLYDVQVRIVNIVKMQKIIGEKTSKGRQTITQEDSKKWEKYLNFEAIGPSKIVTNLPDLDPQNDDDQFFHFNFFFSHRFSKAEIVHTIRGQRKENGQWARYDKIHRGTEILKTKIDPDFIEEKL